LILCDRAIFDFSAYIEPSVWRSVMTRNGWAVEDSTAIMDKRYDAVIHLVTCADGAAEFYGYNNKARFETVEQAIERDLRLREAYLGHSEYHIVTNGSK
jgi:hypothetical protein